MRADHSGGLTTRHLAFLLLINLIWGFNLIASKTGVSEFPPIFFTTLRFGIVALLSWPMLRFFPGQMLRLLLAATLVGAGQFTLLFLGLHLVKDISVVAIATQLGVPFTTLLSVWLLGEVIHWRRKLGIVLAFAGIVAMSFDPNVFAYWPGLLLVVISCFVGSLGLIFIKQLKSVGAMQMQAWLAVGSMPILLAFSLLFEQGQWHAMHQASWIAWCALLFTAVMSSMVAHSGMFYLVSRYPVTTVSPLTLLSPIFSIIFGVTLLHDRLTARLLVGGAITLIGVFIVAAREQKMVDTGT